jgi:hypothetical protein
MKTAPLKVLLLGWDAPAAPAEAVSSTPTLLQALAPRAELTLLLPRLSEPMRLSSLVQTTGLGNLTAEELVLLEEEPEVDRSQHWQWPAAPYAGATHGPEGGPAVPAAPYIGSSEEAASFSYSIPPSTAEETQEGNVGVQEASDLSSAEPEAYPSVETSSAAFEPEQPTEAPEPQPVVEEARPTPAPVELPVHNSILNVALAALQALPTDEAGLNFRVIQYARLATRLAANQNFSVIYASDWQSWLAGMEIRQLTGKPLVLHVYSLAQERNTPADRGWVMEMERMALRRADLILTSSSDLALRVIELYEVPPQRVRRLSRAANQDANLLAETILSALGEVS